MLGGVSHVFGLPLGATLLLLGGGLANASLLVRWHARGKSVLAVMCWLGGFALWQGAAFALEQAATSGLRPAAPGEMLSASFLLYTVLTFPAAIWRFLG